jgi:DNA-binding LacI/PurR family transcriptional regulator
MTRKSVSRQEKSSVKLANNGQIRKRVTLKDVAQVLSVTAATVSKALRDSSDISPETKRLVRRLSDELGYRPNLLAQSLINNKSKMLGVLVPDLRISFFSEAVRGMYEEAEKKGYVCVFLVHDELETKERQKLEFLYDIHADGILLNAAGGGKNNYPLITRMAQEGIRFVCWDRSLKDFGFKSVKIDDVEASHQLTSKLIKEGRKRILFLGPHTGIPLLKDRFNGYKIALKENGIPYRPELVIQSFRSIDDSYNKILSLFSQKLEFDAVVSIGGGITYGAGKAIQEMNRLIPEDVAIGEFGDNDIVYKLGVPFYTVVQKPVEIGKGATDMLIKMIETGEPDEKFDDIIIEFEIVERRVMNKSTGSVLNVDGGVAAAFLR